MSVRFVRNQEVFDTEICWRGLNILGHAQVVELFLGSRCGGRGECGADRVRLREADRKKVNAPNAFELEFLTKDEIDAGIRIARQCFPNADSLSIDIEILHRTNFNRSIDQSRIDSSVRAE